MEGPQPQREPPWAAEIVLSLTGVPKAERATIQELVERSGGRYSPNLSRRCTHLAVPGGVSERSEKLHSALRNRHKWGLHIVDLRWVLESAQAGQRLDEEGFPVHPLPQEQAAPAASARRPVDSWAVGGGGVSEQAADTYQQPQRPGSLPPATVAAAAARAARPANPLRNSVNSRPLSTFTAGQPAPSLQTQAPSAGRSVRWQVSEGSPMQWGACSGAAAAAAAAHAAAAAVLPGQVEQRRLVQQEAEEEMDFSKLPMTQAGFIPAADLLQQLRASTAGLLPAEAAPQPAQRQPQRPLPAEPQPQAQAQQRYGSPASWQPQPMEQPPLPRYAWQGSPGQPSPSGMQVDAALPEPSRQAKPSAMAQQGAAAATSTADLLQQLRLSVAGAPQQQQQQQQHQVWQQQQQQQHLAAKLSTAELRRPAAGPLQPSADPLLASEGPPPPQHPSIPTDMLIQQLHSSLGAGPAQQAAQQQASGRLATEDLLAALRAAPAAANAGRQQRDGAELESVERAAATPDLPLQLQQVAGQLQQAQQPQQRQAAPATAELLQQVQAARMPAASEQQPTKRPAPTTADLLQHLQAVPAPAAAPAEQQNRQQPALSTAELLQQLRASSDMRGMHGMLPAQQAQQGADAGTAGQESGTATQTGDIADLLQQLRQFPPAAAPLPHQPGHPAAPAVPVVQADVAAEAAGRLADRMRSLLQQPQPAAGPEAAAAAREQPGAGSSRSTEELLALLRRQQEQQHGGHVLPAASPAANGGTDELATKLRSLAPQASFTPLRPPQPQPQPQPQQQAEEALQQQQAAQWAGAPVSEDEEMPPAKYQRQEEPEHHAAAAGVGGMPATQQAATAPPTTRAADAGAAGDGGGSLAPTAVVSGQPEDAASPSGSVPASSAGSPPVLRSAAGTPEAPAQADAVSPAGSGSRKPDAASSQVAESCRVFGGMLAIVDPSLPPEEQQRVAAALEQGGGRVAAGGSLARGMTHVVCQPDQALKWLSMGVGIVSPAWVLQSLRTGKQQRCLMVSADASRHLPAASTATDGSTQQAAGSEAGSGGGSSGSSMRTAGQQLSGDLLASKEARQQALLQLAGQGAAAAGGTRASTPGAAGPAMPGGHRPAATPAELLVGVLWSVLESPHTARLEARCKARSAQEEEEVVIIPDSEDEEEEQARLCCISASQAVVADVLCEATEGADHPGDGSAGAEPAAAAAAAWQQDVVLHGPASVTLLLPRDARGELGSDTRCFIVPAGRQGARELTAAQLLGLVHSYYAEQLPPGEQLSLLQAYPAAEGAAAVLRPAFLELAALPRGDLLGPRCAFEGLRKATRDPAGAVYEVLLGS